MGPLSRYSPTGGACRGLLPSWSRSCRTASAYVLHASLLAEIAALRVSTSCVVFASLATAAWRRSHATSTSVKEATDSRACSADRPGPMTTAEAIELLIDLKSPISAFDIASVVDFSSADRLALGFMSMRDRASWMRSSSCVWAAACWPTCVCMWLALICISACSVWAWICSRARRSLRLPEMTAEAMAPRDPTAAPMTPPKRPASPASMPTSIPSAHPPSNPQEPA